MSYFTFLFAIAGICLLLVAINDAQYASYLKQSYFKHANWSRNNNKDFWGDYYRNKYNFFSEYDRITMKKEAKEMFYFGYDNYMKYAFPLVSFGFIL